MKITRRQLRRLILETFHQGIRPMKDVISPEIQHEMRVIQMKNFFIAMKKRGHSNEEIAAAAQDAVQSLYSAEAEGEQSI